MAKNAIVAEQRVAEPTVAAIPQPANSPREQFVTIPTMHAVRAVNMLQVRKFVELLSMQLVILRNIVLAIRPLVLLMLLLLMVRLVEADFSVLVELALREICNVNRLSMGVPVLVTIHLVC
jgi:hypothetical protein